MPVLPLADLNIRTAGYGAFAGSNALHTLHNHQSPHRPESVFCLFHQIELVTEAADVEQLFRVVRILTRRQHG